MPYSHLRILATGITGIHGWPIWQALQDVCSEESLLGICPPAIKHVPSGKVVDMCITDKDGLEKIKQDFRPNCIIHCAGVCDLDVCEERPGWAYDLNVNGAKAISEVFADDCTIVYMSTDLVFSGTNPPTGGYSENDTPDPISVAGKTFRQAELVLEPLANSCIVRLGLPLGDSVTGTKGAIDWVKSRLLKDRPVTLFYDELRSCIWCHQIAEMALQVLKLDMRGVYHFGGNRPWQLYEIGKYVVDTYNCTPELLNGINRHEEENGPPRVGDISMNCDKLKAAFNDAGVVITGFND